MPRDVAQLPVLPQPFQGTLDEGLAALGLDLSAHARTAITGHVRLLLAWNEAINLTSVTEPAAIASRHVVDSLAGASLVGATPHAGRRVDVLDLGSGGGFPGLPLAAALPEVRVTLVDSVGKKVRFLEAAIAATDLGDRASARAARAEAMVARVPAWDVVTARAVGSLAELVELSMPLLRIGGRLVAWKRGELRAELEAAARAAAALGGTVPALHPVTGVPDLGTHVLVTVTKRAATPPGYPRDPAARARQPW